MMVTYPADADYIELPGTDGERSTTAEGIRRLFGDLVADWSSVQSAEFDAIIQRCQQNGWTHWATAWHEWKQTGFGFVEES